MTRTASAEAREGRRHALFIALVCATSIPVALVNPDLAPYCWLALFVPAGSCFTGKRGAY